MHCIPQYPRQGLLWESVQGKSCEGVSESPPRGSEARPPSFLQSFVPSSSLSGKSLRETLSFEGKRGRPLVSPFLSLLKGGEEALLSRSLERRGDPLGKGRRSFGGDWKIRWHALNDIVPFPVVL